jgi:tetratricopeptide (TPR) repeat protein
MSGSPSAPGPLQGRLPALLAVLVALLVFAPSLGGEFLTWDDDVYLTANPLVRDSTPGGLLRLGKAYVSGNWHPLTLWTYALIHRLAGLRPFWYHLAGLLLHLAVTLLAFALFRRLGLSPRSALAGTLLFALHPARTEAVAWISALKDPLSAALALTALLLHLRWRRDGGAGPRLLSLAAGIMAMAAKGTAAVLPALVLLVDGARGPGAWRERLRGVAPWVAAAVPFALAALPARASYEAVLQEAGDSPLYRLQLGVYRLALHFLPRGLAFSPAAPLNPFYLHESRNLPAWGWLAAAWSLLAAAGLLIFLLRRRSRRLAFGASFFLLALLPVLPVVVVGHTADRFLYLPSLGLAFVLGPLLGRLGRRGGQPSPGRGRLLRYLPLLLPLLMVPVTAREIRVWRGSRELWQRAVASYPRVASFWLNLGNAHTLAGDHLRAVPAYDRALALEPGNLKARTMRGVAHSYAGRPDLALADLEAVLAVAPGHPEAVLNRGILRLRQGRHREAVPDLERAARLLPDVPLAWLSLAGALRGEGRREEAEAAARRAWELDPSLAGAREFQGGAGGGAPLH